MKYLQTLFIALSAIVLQAQEEQKLNSFSVELGGTGGLCSFNFSRNIPFNPHSGLNVGIGLSQFDYIYDEPFAPGIPIHVKPYFHFNSKHSVDFGLGITPGYASFFAYYRYMLSVQAGYKYHFSKDRFFFGITFSTAFYDNLRPDPFSPWAGISFGYKFNKIETIPLSEWQNSEKHRTQNISIGAGFIIPKVRLQYEKALNNRHSLGIILNYYYRIAEYYSNYFPGARLDIFARKYAKKQDSKEGWFLQGKVGVGYLFSGYYATGEKAVYGFTYGAGIAGGYKLLIGNHLTVEPILGVHWYAPPINSAPSSEKNIIDMRWYETTGMPLDFQFKFGWQY